MSTLNLQSQAEPLTLEEVQLTDRVARRLHEQIRAFLGQVPAEARNASGLSRYLGIDRTTCQRAVFTASRPYPGLAVVDRLPGVRGMRQLVEAARSADDGVDADALDAMSAALDRFEETLRTLGGSQSALVRRISATPLAESESTLADRDRPQLARQRLFDAAAEVTGRFSETWVAVYLYSPGEDANDQTINVARAHGLVGHVARPDAVPLTFHNFISKKRRNETSPKSREQSFRSLSDVATIGNSPDSVLRPFSTDPPPMVSSRQPGEYLVQAIDTDPSAHGRPVDLMLGTQSTMPHPLTQSPAIEEVWAMINFPVRTMVFDVYLHRDLARQCIPSLDAHLWRPDFATQVGDRWQTRFADGPRLEVLGHGIERAATPVHGRHVELTAFLFDALRFDAGRYVGYRCALHYPIWRTGYCMSFDFSASDDRA